MKTVFFLRVLISWWLLPLSHLDLSRKTPLPPTVSKAKRPSDLFLLHPGINNFDRRRSVQLSPDSGTRGFGRNAAQDIVVFLLFLREIGSFPSYFCLYFLKQKRWGYCLGMTAPLEGTPRGAYNFKVVLLGEGCVGKTSLVLRYVENKFNERHESTLQVRIRCCWSWRIWFRDENFVFFRLPFWPKKSVLAGNESTSPYGYVFFLFSLLMTTVDWSLDCLIGLMD